MFWGMVTYWSRDGQEIQICGDIESDGHIDIDMGDRRLTIVLLIVSKRGSQIE